MAPSFLQKLVKVATPNPNPNTANNTRERISSDAYPTPRTSETASTSARNRAHSASDGSYSPGLASPTTPTQASTTNSKRSSANNSTFGGDSRIPSIITTLSTGGRSLGRNRSKSIKEDKKDSSSKEKDGKNSSRNQSRSREVVGELEPPHLQAGDRRSWGSADTYSTQPNVTIVPPSPLVGNAELDSDDEEGYHSYYDEHDKDSDTQTQPNTTSTTAGEPQDIATPTLPKTFIQNQGPSKTATSVSANTTTPTGNKANTTNINTPTTATPNTNASATTTATTDNIKMSLAPGAYQVRKQSSNKSIGSTKKTPPPEINVATAAAALGNGSVGNHIRAATAPAESSSMGANASANGSNGANVNGDQANGTVTMTPIVESPTDLKFPKNGEQPPPVPPLPNSNANTSTNGVISSSPSSSSSTNLSIQRENTSGSILSPDSSKSSSKRPWRRSTTRKPTGLASAIAASGLAMANPSLSAIHNAQIAPPPIISPGSSKSSDKDKDKQPYMSRSPAESKVSQKGGHAKTRSADLSPRSSKSRKSSIGSGGGNRTRRTSSARSEASEYYQRNVNGTSTTLNGTGDDIRPDYYQGLHGSEDDDSDGSGSEDSSDLDIDDEDIPVTGFAVASNKRNADFHELFPTVPEGDYLIEDYGCALQREILIQGRIYISENHICFHANIFGWITDLSVPIYEITSLEKKMTAFVIPNAIQITTRQAKYTFASFLSRDTTFDVIFNIWRLARPEDGASFLSSGRGSLEGVNATPGGGAVGVGGVAAPISVAAAGVPAVATVVGSVGAVARKATYCTCGKEGKHYTETAMEVTVPGTPEKIHNLIFASGFIKDFMAVDQKLLGIQMSDWAPVSPNSKLLTRNMSYIKPLNGSLGPKQTKCELRDETVYCDFDQYVSTVTTTRTPDVPSGGVFAVKTRTCITWAGPISSKVLVTTQVEWTGRSFIKGIIERSAIDGQKVYHGELEKSMRAYIQQHNSEFLPEGIDVTAVSLEPAEEAAPIAGGIGEVAAALEEKHPTPEEFKRRERERNARGLQWAWDTFDGAWQVARRSTKGALELVRDAWDQSTSTTILWFVIVILVLSNLWTLMRMGSGRAEASRKFEARKTEEREKWVQSIVTVLWDELSAGKHEAVVLPGQVVPSAQNQGQSDDAGGPIPTATQQLPLAASSPSLLPPADQPVVATPKGWEQEVQQLQQTLDMVELRVKAIRESLSKFEHLNSLD